MNDRAELFLIVGLTVIVTFGLYFESKRPPQKQAVMPVWETAAVGLQRHAVPGGWIYHVEGVGITFVPEAKEAQR